MPGIPPIPPAFTKQQADLRYLNGANSAFKPYLQIASELWKLDYQGLLTGPAATGGASSTWKINMMSQYDVTFTASGTGLVAKFYGVYMDSGTTVELPIPCPLDITFAIQLLGVTPGTGTQTSPNGTFYQFTTLGGSKTGTLNPNGELTLFCDGVPYTAGQTVYAFCTAAPHPVFYQPVTTGLTWVNSVTATLVDTNANFTALEQLIATSNISAQAFGSGAYYLAISAGTGAGQCRQINGYTASTGTLTFAALWNTGPASDSTYRIYQGIPQIPASCGASTFTTFAGGSGAYAGTLQVEHNTYDGTVDPTIGGTTLGSSAGYIYKPSVLAGQVTAGTARPTLLVVGDSIANGQGDVAPNTGWIMRACYQNVAMLAGFQNGYSAYTFFSVHSDLPTASMRKDMARYTNNVLCELGTNDLSLAATNANGTNATDNANNRFASVKRYLLAVWAFYAAMGCKVTQTTILPRTYSTDGWQTLANQSPSTNTVCETLTLVNAWLNDTSAAGAIVASAGSLSAVLDVCSIVGTLNTGYSWGDGNTGLWQWNPGITTSAPTYRAQNVTSGGVSGITSTTFVDTNAPFVSTGVALGDAIYIVSGTGSGQSRQVSALTSSSVLGISFAWGTTPDATSVYTTMKCIGADNGALNGSTSELLHPGLWGHTALATAAPVAAYVAGLT